MTRRGPKVVDLDKEEKLVTKEKRFYLDGGNRLVIGNIMKLAHSLNLTYVVWIG